MTTRSFQATSQGALVMHVASPIGRVKALVDPRLRHAQVTVETGEDSGRFADAVAATEFTEERIDYGNRVRVTVPEVRPVTHRNAGSTYNFGGSSYNFGADVTFASGGNFGSVSGIQTTADGDVFIGGQKVVQGGRVVADRGTVVSGPAATITVTVRLPRGCDLLLSTTSAELEAVGDLSAVGVSSVSGSIELGGMVDRLRVETVSADVVAESISRSVSFSSASGSIEVLSYSGDDFEATSMSGSVRATVTPAASNSLRARSMTGDVVTSGARHLDLKTSSVSGRVRNH
ncbi:DUF4097 family beta strand repeat-containing protein [Streptomyces anulatus]|uniref:DUF4097 family beta strand repeat-containing protein n=1 Tax=Streptomyces anulatus TaxID=1892 RepID=UPI001C257B9B|nr:DUF4097 family beta strand repeat-containing protein [Streptomyces anulatus]